METAQDCITTSIQARLDRMFQSFQDLDARPAGDELAEVVAALDPVASASAATTSASSSPAGRASRSWKLWNI